MGVQLPSSPLRFLGPGERYGDDFCTEFFAAVLARWKVMTRTESILKKWSELWKTRNNCQSRFGRVTFYIMAWPRRVLRTMLDFLVFRMNRNTIPIKKGMRPGAWNPRTPRTGVRPTSPHMESCVGIMHSMGNSFRTGNPTSDSDSACRSAFFGILQTWNLKISGKVSCSPDSRNPKISWKTEIPRIIFV